MPIQLLASGTNFYDNLLGTEPLSWAEVLPQNIVIDYGRWFFNKSIQLQLQIFWSVQFNDANRRNNTDRLYNPTQYQIGHWAISTDSFVLYHDRLLFEKQAYTYQSAQIYLGNNNEGAPLVFRRSINSRRDHAQSVGNPQLCLALLNTPAASQGIAQGLDGTFCLHVNKGQEEFVAIDQYQNPQLGKLPVDLKDLAAPDLIQGVLWPGHSLEVGWTWLYNLADSTAIQSPVPVPILGDAVFFPVGEQCSLGNPIPSLNYCSQPYIVGYNPFTGVPIVQPCGSPPTVP